MPAVVTARHLSKRYRLGSGSTVQQTLGEMVYHRLGRLGDAARMLTRSGGSQAQRKEPFWALREVNFEVQQGEVLGVIGRNGAGKSTLLKVLASITRPTSGEVEIRGRVGSLLEVGTGFHPELSGRENIYLSAAVLGMSRREVKAKFGEIVDFAGIGQFLDTPVKRYSSGMYVRLAFGVAAHLEPEVLLIDEVLAVGDAEFQRRCLDRMDGIARGGRTVVFVSHDMGAVQRLCNRVMVLHHGEVDQVTDPTSAVTRYLQLASDWRSHPTRAFTGPLSNVVVIDDLYVENTTGETAVVASDRRAVTHPGQPIRVVVEGNARHAVEQFRLALGVYHKGVRVLSMLEGASASTLVAGRFRCVFELPAKLLRPGAYTLGVGGSREGSGDYVWGTDVSQFEVIENWSPGYEAGSEGLINVTTYGQREHLGGVPHMEAA